MDVFSRRERSQIMSRIRSEGNAGTELRLIKLFRANKIIGWRRKQKQFGKPDFVFPKQTARGICGRLLLARLSALLSATTFK